MTDGRLTIAPGAGAVNSKICFVEITFDVAANLVPTVAISIDHRQHRYTFGDHAQRHRQRPGHDHRRGRIRNGGTVIGTDTAVSLVWNSPAQGTHAITARAPAPPAGRTEQSVSVLIKPPNVAPTITLTTPAAGSTSFSGDALLLSASADDSDGTIARVEFWADGVKLGDATTSPYVWSWPGPRSLGAHAVWATAFDDAGASTPSAQAVVQTIAFALLPVQMQRLTDPDRIAFTIRTTLPAGRAYVIEFATDLAGPWTPLQSGTSDGSPIEITDTTTNLERRFYRVGITN